MIFGGLEGALTVAGRGELYGTLSADGAGLDGSATIDGGLADIINRTFGPVQRIGVEIRVGGVAVPASEILGAVTVDHAMDSHAQSGTFSIGLRNPDGYFGNPLDTHAPAFGTSPIDIYGKFWTASGDRLIPILTNGVVHSFSRKTSGGRQESYAILDGVGRVDHLTVTLSIPAGSGLRRDEIAQRIANQLGIDETLFAACGQVYRVVEYVDADPVRAWQTLMDVEGRSIFMVPDGYLVNPSWGASGEGPLWTWAERDIIAGGMDDQGPSDVVTDVTLTGTQQILHDPQEATGGSGTKSTTITVSSLYQPVSAAYIQAGDCSVTALSAVPDDQRIQVISKTVSSTESRGGEVVTEETITESWRITEATRYVFASRGARNCRTPIFLLTGADPAGNGTEAAYAEQNEAFRETAKTVVRHFFDSPQFLGPGSTPGSDQAPWGNHFLGTQQSRGVRLGKITETWGWYLVGASLKQAVPNTTWEAINPIVGVETRGDGRGAVGHEETYMVTAREVEVIEVTPDNYIKSTAVYTFGWSAGTGNAYWYQGSGPAAQAEETFQLLKKVQTDNVPTGSEDSFVQVETTIDFTGNASPTTKTTRNVGAPPAVDILPSSLPDPSIYANPEQAKTARIARNTETQTIQAQVVSAELEAYHPKREVKTTAGDAETPEELQAMARRTIALSAANRPTFDVAFNPALRIGQVGRVIHRPLGVDATGRIFALRHNVQRRGPSTTSVTILQMPDGIDF